MRMFYHSVPAPVAVSVTSSIQPVGYDVTLICTIELNPLVDVPVTVNTVWTDPYGFMTSNNAQPVMGSTTTYTSTVMVSSFRRGIYTCTATISLIPPFLHSSESQSGSTNI